MSEVLHVEVCGKQLLVRVSYVCPPIPVRSMDWCAYEDGCEEEGHYGYGATRNAALAELMEILNEKYDTVYA